jgi:hypothetical protein
MQAIRPKVSQAVDTETVAEKHLECGFPAAQEDSEVIEGASSG